MKESFHFDYMTRLAFSRSASKDWAFWKVGFRFRESEQVISLLVDAPITDLVDSAIIVAGA